MVLVLADHQNRVLSDAPLNKPKLIFSLKPYFCSRLFVLQPVHSQRAQLVCGRVGGDT